MPTTVPFMPVVTSSTPMRCHLACLRRRRTAGRLTSLVSPTALWHTCVVQCRGYEVGWEACVPRLVARMGAAALDPHSCPVSGGVAGVGSGCAGGRLGVPAGGPGGAGPGPQGVGQCWAA